LVFVGSIAGRLAIPFIGPYSASKFALRALSDALRAELEPDGIAVTLIEPGSVNTPIWAKGRAARERLAAELGADAVDRYRERLEKLFATTARQEQTAMPVEVAGRAIVRAVTAPRPPENVVLGFPARAGSIVALLPARMRQRMLRS
jgi:short-subunit dehydrogenase